jgi:hypothetical protein
MDYEGGPRRMPTRSILDRLSEGKVLLMDGGTGTELQRRGVNVGKGTSITGRPYTTSKGVTTQECEGVWDAFWGEARARADFNRVCSAYETRHP